MVTVEKNVVEYPLEAKDIPFKALAQHTNGTVVVKACNLEGDDHKRIINIANGIGGYSETSRYRLIPNNTITITTDSDSRDS